MERLPVQLDALTDTQRSDSVSRAANLKSSLGLSRSCLKRAGQVLPSGDVT